MNSDCVPANVNNEPTFLELEKDASNLVPKAHQITSTGAQRVTDICLALDAGCPVVFGTYVDTAFLNYTGGIVGKQNQNDPNGGGHCMVLLGYTISGTTVTFIGRNSWGVTWGESGDFRASTAFVAQMSELFAIALVASTGGAA